MLVLLSGDEQLLTICLQPGHNHEDNPEQQGHGYGSQANRVLPARSDLSLDFLNCSATFLRGFWLHVGSLLSLCSRLLQAGAHDGSHALVKAAHLHQAHTLWQLHMPARHCAADVI